MIPDFVIVDGIQWPLLPPGIYDSTMDEIFTRYAITPWRLQLFYGLKKGIDHLFSCGCRQVFLDGSYITQKLLPADYEVIWDMQFVDGDMLDPIFLDFSNGRYNQKQKYFGEYFPDTIEAGSGKPFLDFFQQDKDTGSPKGIIRVTNYLPEKGETNDLE